MVRVQKLAFFFSYSACFSCSVGGFCWNRAGQSFCLRASAPVARGWGLRVDGVVYRTSCTGSSCERCSLADPSSLASLKLDLRPSLPLALCWKRTPFRDLVPAIASVAVCVYVCFSYAVLLLVAGTGGGDPISMEIFPRQELVVMRS
jgi:hypothetical protein